MERFWTLRQSAATPDLRWQNARTNPSRQVCKRFSVHASAIFCQECLDRAEELKLEGNEHFRARRWDEAICSYRTALGQLPNREKKKDNGKGKGRDGVDDNDDEDDDSWPSRKDVDEPTETETVPESPPTEQDLALAKTRAVLNANIAACYVKLVCFFEILFPRFPTECGSKNDPKEAVAACTQG